MAKQFKLEIIFDAETKQCKLTGPINDPDLCLLGLEIAKRCIQDNKSKMKSMILTAPKLQMPSLKEILKNGS